MDRDQPNDIELERRPGVPMEHEPHRVPIANWTFPERQRRVRGVTHGVEVKDLTPVFSSAVRPRGFSGYLRRRAYKVPGHHPAHWMTLLLADRVDVIESKLRRLFKLALVPAGVFLALRALRA